LQHDSGNSSLVAEILADGSKQPQPALKLDSPLRAVYERLMAVHLYVWIALFLWSLSLPTILPAAENPITLSPLEAEAAPQPQGSYDFDAPPQGMFRSITMAEGFEEELGFRRTHEIVPVKPTERFGADVSGIFIVFTLHQHYQAFQVFGRCFPEAVPGLDPHTIVGQDVMYIALEDESGYLKLSSPQGRWKPGRYRVEIHAGEQVNEVSLMGTMRFTVAASHEP
jgi:hypothetical protein